MVRTDFPDMQICDSIVILSFNSSSYLIVQWISTGEKTADRFNRHNQVESDNGISVVIV